MLSSLDTKFNVSILRTATDYRRAPIGTKILRQSETLTKVSVTEWENKQNQRAYNEDLAAYHPGYVLNIDTKAAA